jgi:hypothetical protein
MGFKELSLSVLQNLVQNSKYLTFIHVIKTTFFAMIMNILISLSWGENIYRSEADTNIYRSEADINKPLMRSDMTWKGRCLVGDHRASTEPVKDEERTCQQHR